MIRGLLSLVCGFALLSGAFAEGEDDPNDGARFEQDGPNEYTFSWLSHPGRTYFVQHSEDLITWTSRSLPAWAIGPRRWRFGSRLGLRANLSQLN